MPANQVHAAAPAARATSGEPPPAPTPAHEGRAMHVLRTWLERASERIGAKQLPKLWRRRDLVQSELRSIPERMQKITNQATLVLDLVDDYRAGTYRAIPWRSLVIAAGALLYTVSPNDVVPDFLPVLGQLDDALVLAVAMRLIRKDLENYARYRGLDVRTYF